MLLRALLASAIALLISNNASAGVVGLSQTGIDEALRTATAQKKAVLIEFSTSWCAACREFEKNILKDWKVDRALKDIVFLRYDAGEMPGLDAAGRYAVNAYPTFLAIDQNGLERFRRTLSDIKNVRGFLALIDETKSLFEDEAVVRQRLKDNPGDTRTKLDAAKWYASRKQTREAIHELDAIARSKGSAPEKAEASQLGDRLRRLAQWKDQLVASAVKSVRADFGNANIDDLITATVGSGLSQSEIRGLYKEVFKAHADSDELVPYLYVALAAGQAGDALPIAERLARQTSDPARLAVFAECKLASGDATGALDTIDDALALAKGSPLAIQLQQDRTRIDARTGDSAEVIKARMKASDLWQRLETLDQLRYVPPPNPVGGGLYGVVKAVQKLGATVAGTCRSAAGSTNRAYVTLDIDNTTGQVVSTVLYSSDSANQQLRDCIDRELRAAQLPIITTKIPIQSTVIMFNNGP